MGLEKLNAFLGFYPYHINGRAVIGEIFLDEKNYVLARKHIEFVLNEYKRTGRMSMEIPYAYALMGRLSEEEGDLEGADNYFSQVLKMTNQDGSYAKAKAYFSKQKKGK